MSLVWRHRRALTLPVLLGALVLMVGWGQLSRGAGDDVPRVTTLTAPPLLAAQPLPGQPPVTRAQAIQPGPVAAATAPTGPQVSQEWVGRIATASGISAVAVSAYADAVLTEPAGCALGWTTLAGIGWVESEQGTVGGRTLEANGRPSTDIAGPALDGRDFAAIPAVGADGAVVAGEPAWDRAVGPMQFIASTWATWGRDGDHDGIADPQDLDDAAAAATAYLCGTGQDLTTGPGWSAAVFAYNHSDAYVQQVYSAAATYAARTSG